jgi:hypothetical protein
VSSDQAKPATLDYGVLVIHIEPVDPAEASRRLMSGWITGSQGSAQSAFEVPRSNVYPHRRTTGRDRTYRSRSGWPEYILSYDIHTATTGLQLRSIDHLIRPGLPSYANGLAAVAELIYRVPPDEPNIDQTGRIVVALPDTRGRLGDLTFAGHSVRVPVEGKLVGCVLKATWREAPETVNWERHDYDATPGVLKIITGSLPAEMRLFLCDVDGDLIDVRGWSGENGDRPEDPQFGRTHVQRLLREGEHETVEYKHSLKEDETKRRFARTVAAFANADGGIVMVGVDNEGRVVGWHPAGLRDQVADLLRSHVRPFPPYAIRQVTVGRKPIQLVVVGAGQDRPYRADGVVVLRSHGTTRDAESDEIRAIVARGVAAPATFFPVR